MSAKASTGSTNSGTAATEPDSKPRHWFTILSLAIAVVAVGIAIVGWFRPSLSDDASPTFTANEVDDAKANVCTAFRSVRDAVVANTNLVNPGGEEPIGALTVAANARVALYAGNGYLRDVLVAEPAAPTELTQAVDSTANTLQQLSIGYLAGDDSTLDPLRQEFHSQVEQVEGLC